MAIGVVAGDAAGEPADVFLAIIILQILLDLRFGQIRIAIFVQQAIGGGQNRAGAVEIDGSAFHDDPGIENRQLELLRNPRRHRIVIIVRRIFSAPGVKSPIDDRQFFGRAFSITNAGP